MSNKRYPLFVTQQELNVIETAMYKYTMEELLEYNKGRDYINRNKFAAFVNGISGSIDTLKSIIAIDAEAQMVQEQYEQHAQQTSNSGDLFHSPALKALVKQGFQGGEYDKEGSH